MRHIIVKFNNSEIGRSHGAGFHIERGLGQKCLAQITCQSQQGRDIWCINVFLRPDNFKTCNKKHTFNQKLVEIINYFQGKTTVPKNLDIYVILVYHCWVWQGVDLAKGWNYHKKGLIPAGLQHFVDIVNVCITYKYVS